MKKNLIGSLLNGKKKNKKKANSAKSTDGGVEVPGAHLQAALGSIPIKGVKQKATDEEHPNIGNAKKLKPNSAEGQSKFLGLVGTIWDSVNWSCTYDALFTILYYIWTTNPHKWNREFGALNPGAALLAESYCKVFDGTYTSEQSTSMDIVRAYLNNQFPNKFPYGHRGTVLAKVI